MTMTAGLAEPQICGRLGDEHGTLPLLAVDIDAEVCELVATTVVKQTFENTRSTAVEATYVFPLPDRSGVTSFVADLAGRVVEGRLDERGKARAEYEEAIASGHRAAIAEEDRPGVFTMRVGNLQPGERAEVTLTLTGALPVDDAVAEYRFPLVVAPRYVAGAPVEAQDVGEGVARDTDRVPDASRVTPPVLLPGQASPVRLSLRAALRVTGLTAAGLTSTLHDVDVDESGDEVTVALRPGERLDRDVIVRWKVDTETASTSAVLAADEVGDGGTWQVTVVPPSAPPTVRPRDVVVVLDRSGSMTGWKMVAARRAAARVVDTLAVDDRFAVLAFDNVVERPAGAEGLQAGTDGQRWSAVSWLAELNARGGTEMLEPLREAARLLSGTTTVDRDRYLVLVTDGQVAGEDEILRVWEPLAGKARIFAIGIDQAVNAAFLRRLAAVGAGRLDLVESEDRLDDVVVGLHRRISPPVAKALTVSADGVELLPEDTTPRRAPDLFAGVPLTLSGRVSRVPAGDVRFTVAGEGFQETTSASLVHSTAVRTVWARARVRDLEDQYVSSGQASDELADRIVNVSLTHQVLSRFTAFVAVDRDRRTETTAPAPVTQPVELPRGWAAAAAPMMATDGAPRHASAAHAGPPRTTLFRKPAPMRDGGVERAVQPVALDAYLGRIEQLLAALAGRSGGDTAEIETLVDDLESVGAPDELLDALRELVRAVRDGVGVGEAAAAVERAVAEQPSRGQGRGSRRRGAFWRA